MTPLSKPKLVAVARSQDKIQAVITVPLDELIDGDLEWLNDFAEEQIIGEIPSLLISDIGYKVVGHSTPTDDGSGDVLIEVSANIEAVDPSELDRIELEYLSEELQELAADDGTRELQCRVDDLIYEHFEDEDRASEINNQGVVHQLERLADELGYEETIKIAKSLLV